MGSYYLAIDFPKRMLPYFEDKTIKLPAQVILQSEDIKPISNKSFDITLKNVYYIVMVIIEGNVELDKISRSELIESHNSFQQYRTKAINEASEQIIAGADKVQNSNPLILRHLFKKNIKPYANDTIIIAVAVPTSLKDKCTKWFCTLIVPASCITLEQPIQNIQLVSLELTQKTYEVHYPVSDTEAYHKFHTTHWKKTIVSREEIYEAHMNMLRTFDFYVKNELT